MKKSVMSELSNEGEEADYETTPHVSAAKLVN